MLRESRESANVKMRAGMFRVTPGPLKAIVVSRPSRVAARSYEQVTRAYFGAVHSVLTGQKRAPEGAAELEKYLVKITGFPTGPPARN